MNLTSQQRELLGQLASEHEHFSSAWDESRGVLSFARSESLQAGVPPGAAENETAREALLRQFLEKHESLFGPPDLFKSVRRVRARTDSLGFAHHEYQQVLTGRRPAPRQAIEVYGSKLAAHFDAAGQLIEVQSSCYRSIEPQNRVAVSAASLRRALLTSIREVEGFDELQQRIGRREKLFPLMQQPRLVVYPWKGRMIYAWATYGYGVLRKEEQEERGRKTDQIAFGQMFFDAETGELFLFAPTRKGLETQTTGTGLGCTPLGGPFENENLQVVHVDSGSTYLLKNKTTARDIVTYDANANSSWVYPNIPSLIESGTIPVSSDTDGDHNWSRTAASTTDAERTASQQPEVDEHATCAELYDWYAAIGGRVGWDDGQYSAPLVPNQTINVVAHTFDELFGTSRSVNAFFDKQLVSGHWVSHLAFFDGDPTGATSSWVFDYLAGSRAIVAHEYQHAVTDFSFIDGMGNPGLTYSDWLAAVHEGLSDVFGGLFSGNWWMGNEVSPTGQIFRNLAFPRDSAAADPSKFDHFADRNNITGTAARYHRGDILAHAAYLMAQGGIHQRSSRTPVFIPVRGMGTQTAGALQVYKAARIWYRALAEYLSNIGAATGLPANDENVFRTIRNGCVSAAIDLFGTNSVEHKTTVLAWHAVGLHPTDASYGPDVTFVTWGADWWMSRPYIGLSSPDWSARDLFINNGGTSEWNAQINVLDGGTPTQFENNVYCRVRNVGEQTATNVQVQFEYTKITAGGGTWLPMTDKDGNIQVLNVGSLAPGQSNFPDGDQDTPPAAARVKWWIPPLEPGETVDHFCIRARAFSINDVNPHNNEVQSNIAFTPYVPGSGFRTGFFVGNDTREALPVKLQITHTLPRDWKVDLVERVEGLVLKPGESRRVHAIIQMPASQETRLEAPFDGRVRGKLSGAHSGTFTGTLSRARLDGSQLVGEMALLASDGAHVGGRFTGTIELTTGKFEGMVSGVRVEGCLRPDRIVNIGQYSRGQALGGLSLQVQVPVPVGSCFGPLPPTDTTVERGKKPERVCEDHAKLLLDGLTLKSQNVCAVNLRSVLLEVKFKSNGGCD